MKAAARDAGGGPRGRRPGARADRRTDGRDVRRRGSPTGDVRRAAARATSSPSGGRDGGAVLRVPCPNAQPAHPPSPQPQRSSSSSSARRRAAATLLDRGLRPVGSATATRSTSGRRVPRRPDWTPVVLADSTGAARIANVIVVDVVGSTDAATRHRRRLLLAVRPAGHARSAPGRRSRCRSTRRSAGRSSASSTRRPLVAVHAARSRPPASRPGAHTLRAAAIDVYGRADNDPGD